jgi:hypothetical protein
LDLRELGRHVRAWLCGLHLPEEFGAGFLPPQFGLQPGLFQCEYSQFESAHACRHVAWVEVGRREFFGLAEWRDVEFEGFAVVWHGVGVGG